MATVLTKYEYKTINQRQDYHLSNLMNMNKIENLKAEEFLAKMPKQKAG